MKNSLAKESKYSHNFLKALLKYSSVFQLHIFEARFYILYICVVYIYLYIYIQMKQQNEYRSRYRIHLLLNQILRGLLKM